MNDYPKVYKELYEIFKYIPREELCKIPRELIKNIKDNMDNGYEYKVTHISDFRNQDMMKETRAVLSILYRDYWASKEERMQILEQEQKEIFQEEEYKKENSVVRNELFKNRDEKKEYSGSEIIEYKEGIFRRILNKIKSIFSRKR